VPLTFANFRQIIPSQILTRGRDYVRNEHILDLSFEEEERVWEAQVEGTVLYDVQITLLSNGSLVCRCTCPYDAGEYCKHVAAVLYAIEEAFPDYVNGKPRRKPASRQTRHDKLRQRLEKASREQLVSVLLELTQTNSELLNQMLIRLDTGDAKPMDYRRVIKDVLRVGRDRDGYLDYAGTARAGRKLNELFVQAQQWQNAGQTDKATGFYLAVIDELVPIMHHVDDSSGSLGGCIDQAIEELSKTIAGRSAADHEALFTCCIERAQRKDFREWDWGSDLLAIAGQLVNTPSLRARFVLALDNIEAAIPKSRSSRHLTNFELEKIALLRLALIERFDGEGASRQFMRDHVHFDRVRMELIERCIQSGASDEAMRQIQAGITSGEQRHMRGLVNQYEALRVKLLRQQGKNVELIEAARVLWLNRGDQADLDLLRSTIPATEWGPFVDKLAKDTRRPEQLAGLFAQENRWRDLITLVQTHDYDSRILHTHREQLEKRFPDEVAAIYERIVRQILEQATGRAGYRQAIAYLRQMKTIGHAARADAIIQNIHIQYANRRALLDELAKM
jgi:hypothetical protein